LPLKDFFSKYWRWILFSGFFILFFSLLTVHDFNDMGGDSAQYIILAESLASGQGYHAVNYPDKPFFYHYPPLFSLFLMPIVYFFGRNFFLMHCLLGVFGFFTLIIFYFLFKKYSDSKISFIAVCLLMCTIPFFNYISVHILSEMVYLFFSAGALFALAYYSERNNAVNRDGFVFVFLLAAAYLTRYSALALVVGVLIFLLVKGRVSQQSIKKIFFVGGIFLLVFLLWRGIANFYNHGSEAVYLHQFSMIDPYNLGKGSVVDNLGQFWSNFGNRLLYYIFWSGMLLAIPLHLSHVLLGIFSFIILCLIIYGIWQMHREKGLQTFSIYFFIYLCLIASWPFGQASSRETMRFLLPILPFICVYFIYGLYRSFTRLSWRIFYIVITILILISAGTILTERPLKSTDIVGPHVDLMNIYHYMHDSSLEKDTVLTRYPVPLSFYTGYPALVFPYTDDAEIIKRFIKEKNIKYIVIDHVSSQTRRYLVPAVVENIKRLNMLYRSGHSVLLEIKDISEW